MSELNGKIANAAKWSGISEVLARLVGAITSIILARLLAPEAFGAVATITMIISFAELFTDAGFQKYLIQHQFRSEEERREHMDIAFWTNLALSLVLWGIIVIFRHDLARLSGSPGLGNAIAIACASIPLAAFSSIQQAGFKKDLDFKSLFIVRMAAIAVPLVVTVPLAIILRSYWALIIGTIVLNLCNAVLLTVMSSWRPHLHYSWSQLKEMLSFSCWTIFESLSIWLTNYADIFIVGLWLNEYSLGIYKTSMTTVGQFTGIITAATTPVLFSGLSRLQNDDEELRKLFLAFQKKVAILLMPLGVGLLCYRQLVTDIMLGSQWNDAAGFIGLWGIMSAFTILLAQYCSEVFRAKGRPRLSALAQWLHIIVLVPVILIFVRHSFEALYTARALVRIESILVQLTILWCLVRLSPMKVVGNIVPEIGASAVMGAFAVGCLALSRNIVWQLISIILCMVVYFAVLCIWKDERGTVKYYLRVIYRRILAFLSPVLPDKLYLRLYSIYKAGSVPSFRHPETFNDKIQWMKVHLRRPEMTAMVDKCEAKKVIAAAVGDGYVVPTLGVWDRPEDIDISSLPDSFVLKTTHDCGGVVICRDKSSFDLENARSVLGAALSRRFYHENREWPYKGVTPRIIAEAYLDTHGEDLYDYKFFCFDGVVRCMKIDSGRFSGQHHTDYFDADFNPLPFWEDKFPPSGIAFTRPEAFDRMKELSRTLSKGWPFLRVDMYYVDGRVWIGELTFFPDSGFGHFSDPEWERTLGEWIKLPE